MMDRTKFFEDKANLEFVNRYFRDDEVALLLEWRVDEVKAGHFVEPAYDVLIRMGFLAEMRGDYGYAFRCYNGDPLPSSDVEARMALCRKKMKEGENA